MKTIRAIVLVFTAFLSLPVIAQTKEDLFNKELERIVAQYEAKKISQSEAAKEIFIASKSYMQLALCKRFLLDWLWHVIQGVIKSTLWYATVGIQSLSNTKLVSPN